jgi:hypothetical protein
MSVTIDPTSSDDGPGSIEFSLAFKVGANGGDYTIVDSEVADKRRGPRSVYNRARFEYQFVFHMCP